MQVEIWSDIMCPFCYIGKRHFEQALAGFEGKDDVQITWRSFQLNPDMKAQPGTDIYTWLAKAKGMSREQSVQMHRQVADMAAEAGLTYDFDKAVIANSFDAHRLIQLAKSKSLGDAAEEALFKAYFTEGRDTGSHQTLTEIARETGLDEAAVQQMLAGSEYADEVEADIREAQNLGVRGVPFFVIDRKYAVSGAQPAEVFLDVFRQAAPAAVNTSTDGAVCNTDDGQCI